MNATTEETLFLSEFSPATDAAWRSAAEESLEGAPFEKKLVTRTPEGIDLQPIYSRTSVAAPAWKDMLPGFAPFARGVEPLGVRASGWSICQPPAGTTLTEANRALLDDLNRGQNAVMVPLDGTTALPAVEKLADLRTLLAGADLTAVPVHLPAGLRAKVVAELLGSYLKELGVKPAAIQGALLSDPVAAWLRSGALAAGPDAAISDMGAVLKWTAANQSPLRVVGVDAAIWGDAGANAVQELAFGLATGVDYVRRLGQAGFDADAAAARTLFTWSLGSHFFIEIAKLRAARLLWARAMAAAGGGAAAQKLVSHGRVTVWNKTVLDPHNNLLRATTEAFAGVVGGCQSLEILPFDAPRGAPSDLARRLARNLHIILAEECQLGRVVDPAGGSYYVETLTAQLAEKAWALFQDIEKRGGMIAAITAGYPQGLVEKTAADRIASVEGRRDAVIGTNLHPNLKETVPPAAPAAPVPAASGPAIKRLVARRRSEPFETLRRRTEAHVARAGARPKVFLATMGPRKQHAARAEFTAGFFAAAGFESIPNKGFETPEAAVAAATTSGAPIVVICSTDDTYPALVPPIATALKASAKPPVVVVAGLPATPELQQQFKAAGVDEFIHIRANCAKLLSDLQNRLGLPSL